MSASRLIEACRVAFASRVDEDDLAAPEVARRPLIAAKQNDLRLPDDVAVKGVWGKWIYGK